MEKCRYEEVSKECESGLKGKESFVWKPFLKQLLVCSGAWTSVFLYGMSVGAPTVYIPQLRREAGDHDFITDDMASWLSSAYGFSGFPFVLIMAILTRFFGRKIPFIIGVIDNFAAFAVLYFSSNVTHIMISQIMQGLFSASQIVITLLIFTEYTSPKYRGIFLTIKSATMFWGIWASNAIGTFFHWKFVPILGMVCAFYSFITLAFWPESPYWLASKGRFEECAASHRWLKGCDEISEKELQDLINSQKEHIVSLEGEEMTFINRIKDTFKIITSRKFYKPTSLSLLTGCLGLFSGKLVCTVYALDIIKKITNSESTAYTAMLVLDGITVLSMYGGCVLSKYLKRRTLLLGASCIAVVFLFTLSLYLYLIRLHVFVENKYVTVILLGLFSLAISCGPLIMSTSVYGELIPVRSRNISVCIIALCGKLMIALVLKTSPYIIGIFGLHGLFLTFGVCSSICNGILYKYLPETKDKTLREIADIMNGVRSNDKKRNLLSNKL